MGLGVLSLDKRRSETGNSAAVAGRLQALCLVTTPEQHSRTASHTASPALV